MREAHQPPTTSPAGPPHDHTPGSSSLLPPSAKSDRIQQNPAETRVRAYPNSRAPARTRNSRPIVAALAEQNRAPSHVIPAPTHVAAARHSTPPSRTLPASFPYPPTSFPRRRESLLPARIPPQSAADSTYRLESPSPNRHANNRAKPNRRRDPQTPPWPAILYTGNARGVPQHLQEYS